MNERRYNEAEVGEILQRATEQQSTPRQLRSADGMTLGELQDIGREVGIPVELIARAAQSLDRGGRPATRHFLGFPIGVGRTVELERKLTDAEWERLVVDLRETFDARGALRQDGALRQWTNGNLQALLEPTDSGHRLRLRTLNGAARAWMTAGIALVGVGVVSMIAALTGDVPRGPDIWSSFLSMAVMGAGAFGIGALRLPAWSRLRRRQMEEIANRISETTSK